jgi:hypothetical protein
MVLDDLISLLAFLDYATRVFCLLTHLAYLLILLLNKELHERSMVQKHHTNLIGLLIGLHYCAWIGSSLPNTGNQALDVILCIISEFFWATSKYARGYSVLVLAIYRLIAVYKLNLFKEFVKSKVLATVSILIVWAISSLIFVVSKSLTHTLPGHIMCHDGYSPTLQNSIDYYLITSTRLYANG